jgi:hypothetical protein
MPVASYYSVPAQNWYHAKKVGVVSAHPMKACTGLAVRQVVFTDVQITIRQKAAVLPVLRALLLLAYTKKDAASDWLFIKRHCVGTKGLPGAQIQN